MFSQRCFRTCLTLAALWVAAACSEGGTGVDSDAAFDAARVEADLRRIGEVLGSEVWSSFRVLGERVPAPQPSGAIAPAQALEPVTLSADPRRAAILFAERLLESGSGSALVPSIPFEVRGTTFVLDPGTLQYVADPERSGAPENGVRFILYAVNPLTGEPVPTVEIGYADLTDEGDALEGAVSLRLVVVSGDVTYLDYLVTAGGTESSGALTVAGFVSDGETRVHFNVAVTGQQSGGVELVDVQFRIAIEGRPFEAAVTLRNVSGADGSMGQVEVVVHISADVVSLAATGGPESIHAEFRVNGELFATVSGDPLDPEIRGADGRPLTREEREALHRILALSGMVFDMFAHLMQPVGVILGFQAVS